MKNSILIMLHCKQDTGYAISKLERIFELAALKAGYKKDNIFWSYSKVITPSPNTREIDYYTSHGASTLSDLCKKNRISTIIAFDLPYPTPVAVAAKELEIGKIVSYWGASMSGLNSGLKLFAKKIEWYLRKKSTPTQFIFESESMRATATHGRGIPVGKTVVIPLGVDGSVYYPQANYTYAYDEFDIPKDRKIIFFSGHMEERKGVRVLIQAMKSLEETHQLETFHLLICGNKDGEEAPFLKLLKDSTAKDHVTFGGYRDDIPQLMRSSYLGAIASTGWDSFTMSSVEMLASGLPLIVSELQGLKETIEPGVCGEYVLPGNHKQLADIIFSYGTNPDRYNDHRLSARTRAETQYSMETQIDRISKFL